MKLTATMVGSLKAGLGTRLSRTERGGSYEVTMFGIPSPSGWTMID